MEIKKLTSQEIEELNIYAAQKILAENTNLLADIGNALFEATRELGEAQIKVAQLKHYKDVVTEQNRALKTVVQSG
jgi:hypothetical protein